MIDVQKTIALGKAAGRLLEDETFRFVTTGLMAQCHTQIFRTAALDDTQRKIIWDRYHAIEDVENELIRLRDAAQDLVDAIENDELPALLGYDPEAATDELVDED